MFQICGLLRVSVRESQVRDACRAAEAEVVGSAASLSFCFALGLASPKLFPTQMSSVFSARSSVPDKKTCQTRWPGQPLSFLPRRPLSKGPQLG